ncbi:DNA/RNA nuclease SfsA [Carnobacterium gallinarum]|uniref:DNA/RNA nuclease SfsA n=1 Tax=Carnobacterium gallinarum TaxID=2749 RepID=UPI0005547379|nr:DNA/RNA nuclease SfsA [Carnobacterium gallinarum]
MADYQNIIPATFLERPNRFIALCEVEGQQETVHVKNTGRCKELLLPGVTVYLNHVPSATRKTDYDLIAVKKGDLLINIDSQVPNEVAVEGLRNGKIKLPEVKGKIVQLKREVTYLHSKFDIYFETDQAEKVFVEVKGITLENHGIVSFPDAPTIRGLKHVNELIKAVESGYLGAVCFIVQMETANYATINQAMQPELEQAIKNAQQKGVAIVAYTCHVSPSQITIKEQIQFK